MCAACRVRYEQTILDIKEAGAAVGKPPRVPIRQAVRLQCVIGPCSVYMYATHANKQQGVHHHALLSTSPCLRRPVASKLGVPVEQQLLFHHKKELTQQYHPKTLLDMDMHTGFALQGYDMVSQPRACARSERLAQCWRTLRRCGAQLLVCTRITVCAPVDQWLLGFGPHALFSIPGA